MTGRCEIPRSDLGYVAHCKSDEGEAKHTVDRAVIDDYRLAPTAPALGI
jgi:hypothetical protein